MSEDIGPGDKEADAEEPAYTIGSWSAEQAIAVYEFCTLVQEGLWRRHARALFDHLHERGEVDGPLSAEELEREVQLHLRLEPGDGELEGFDDELPF